MEREIRGNREEKPREENQGNVKVKKHITCLDQKYGKNISVRESGKKLEKVEVWITSKYME